MVAPSLAGATTFTVNDPGEAADATPVDGVCATAGAVCTLRAAIEQFNSEVPAFPYVINFSSDVVLIASTPQITQPVTIDGCNGLPSAGPCATIDVQGAGAGIRLASAGQVVRGLAFKGTDSSSFGISLSGGGSEAVIAGNWFGLDDAGAAGAPAVGVYVDGSVSDVTIGGTTVADRNVFANGITGIELAGPTDTTIQGNYFSVMPNGTAPTTGLTTGILVGASTFGVSIGGALSEAQQATPACDGPCNVIGASTTGIDLTSPPPTEPRLVKIHGNHVGVGPDGISALADADTGTTGISVGESLETDIGDGTAARRNVIGGSWNVGIRETGTAGTFVVAGNFIGMNAAGTAALPIVNAGVVVAGSSGNPTVIRDNRFTHDLATGVALEVAGESASVVRNVFGVGTGGEALPMAQALRLTGTNAEVGGTGAFANVFCGSTAAAAIEIDAGSFNYVGRNFIGTTDAAGTACPGAPNHSGVRFSNNATDNIVGVEEIQQLTVTGTANDAFVVSGTGSVRNDVRYFRASGIGGQILDLGPGIAGDSAGNPGMVAGNVQAPTVTLASTGRVVGTGAGIGAQIRVYRTTRAAGFQPSDVEWIDYQTDADGGTWSVPMELGNGSIGGRVAVAQVLSDGTMSELTSAATMIDESPPATTIESGPSGPTADSTPTFAFGADEATSEYWCVLGDVDAFTTCANPFTTAPLADGTYTIKARGVDLGGRVDSTPATRTFTVDTTAPDTNVGEAPTGTIRTTSTSVTFAAGAETGATFQCSIDGAAYATCSSPLALTGLAQGAHTVDVRALDAVGNADATPARASFSVDSLAPAVTFTPAIWIVDAMGRTKPQLRCIDASLPCTGSITVKSAVKIKPATGAKRFVTFATARYTRRTATAAPLTLTLSKPNRALLTALGSVRVKVTIVSRDPHGNARTTNRTITLRSTPPTR